MPSNGTTLIRPRKGVPRADRLTISERVFCAEYIASCNNATEACKVAYPENANPASMGNKVLQRNRVKQYLGQILNAKLEATGLTAERVLRHLENALFMDFAELMQSTGDGAWTFKKLEDIPKHVRQLIQSVKCKVKYYDDHDETDFEVKLMSKDEAMKNVLKYLGLLSPDVLQQNFLINQGGGRMDWDSLCTTVPDDEDDIVEGKIAGLIGSSE